MRNTTLTILMGLNLVSAPAGAAPEMRPVNSEFYIYGSAYLTRGMATAVREASAGALAEARYNCASGNAIRISKIKVSVLEGMTSCGGGNALTGGSSHCGRGMDEVNASARFRCVE